MSNAEKSDSLESVLSNLPDLIRQRVKQLEEREREAEELKRVIEQENPCLGHPSDVLHLNVGGTRIDVLRRTLTSVEGSMLASRFSGRWDDSLEKDADGNFFIDQPIELFLPMVNYLRARACMTPRVPFVKSPKVSGELYTDFMGMLEYYGMTLGVYPFEIKQVYGNSDSQVSGYPEYEVNTEQRTLFQLLPCKGNHNSSVKSFEVTFGRLSTAQVGWMVSYENLELDDQTSSVGGVEGSIGIDCVRSCIAYGEDVLLAYIPQVAMRWIRCHQ